MFGAHTCESPCLLVTFLDAPTTSNSSCPSSSRRAPYPTLSPGPAKSTARASRVDSSLNAEASGVASAAQPAKRRRATADGGIGGGGGRIFADGLKIHFQS